MNPVQRLALRNFPRNYQMGDVVGGISAAANGFMQGIAPQYSQASTGADPAFNPNWVGLGMVGAYLGSQRLLNRSNDRNYQAYRNRWIRDYQIPSLIQDPNKFGDQYTSSTYAFGGKLADYGYNRDLVRNQYQTGGMTRGMIPTPTYQGMQTGSDPYMDKEVYSSAFKDYYYHPNQWPGAARADRSIASDYLYQKDTSAYNDWMRYSNNSLLAQQDAASQNLMTPDQIHQELNRPLVMPPDAVKGKGRRYQVGGTAPVQAGDTRMTQDQMMQFNKFNQFVNDKGYQGSDKLNNQTFSKGLYSQFQAANPDVQLNYDQMIPLAQKEQYILRQTAQNFAAAHGDPNAANLYSNITPPDNMYGPKTNSYSFPNATVINKYNGQVSSTQNLGALSNFGAPAGDDYVTDSSGDLVKKKMGKGGNWIAGAINPKHKGYCTPMTKSTCTPRRAAFARRAKAHFKQDGGMTLNSAQEQSQGYYAHPNASYLHFPGKGQRTFVPGPFPVAVMDDGGVQILDRTPIRTRGNVTEVPIFMQGGEVQKNAPKVKRGDATIEAEKGELIFGAGAPGDYEDQDKRVGTGLFRVGGKKHYNGGTPLKAYPGDFVFSNDNKLAFDKDVTEDLTGDTPNTMKQRTPAKLADKYMDLNKFITMSQDKDADPISKKTAIYNVNNFMDRLAEIAYAQEEKKGFPTGIPAFAQASLQSRGYDAEALQAQLSQGYMKQGGEVQKYQTGGITDDIYKRARFVTEVPQGYSPLGTQGMRTYYQGPNGSVVVKNAPPASQLEPDAHKLLTNYGTRQTNNLSTYSYDDLLKGKYVGQDTPDLRAYWDQYYKGSPDDYVYTGMKGNSQVDARPTPYSMGEANAAPHGSVPDFAGMPNPNGGDFSNYSQYPNNKFNLNSAELYGIYAANKQYPSRYPSAYRNYEIQNAKALTASAYSPISEQPYINAIRRSTIGLDNNNLQGPSGYARGLGAYNGALNAQQQAVGQVYAQNQGRKDQANAALAQLEIADGQDRVANQSLYDNKLETLAYNKEQQAKGRVANNAALINQMQRDRESKSLFNVMSDYYQINPNNTIGMKPTYKLENGKITQVPRNMADLIKASGQTQNAQYINTLEGVFRMMQKYGITNGSFVDDVLKSALIPPR